MAAKKASGSFLKVGKCVIVRTVTVFDVGRITAIDDKWIYLEEASWVADTGRYAQALASGVLSEVERYPGDGVCAVAIGAVADVAPWDHELPKVTK